MFKTNPFKNIFGLDIKELKMNKKKGQTIAISTLFLSVVVLLVAVLTSFIIGNNYFVQKRYQQKIAFNLAEAGLDKAIHELNSDPNFTGETVSTTKGTFITTVIPITSKIHQVESTGYYPSQSSPKTQKTTRIQIEITTVDVAFHYGVQVGQGGLVMKNNSLIFGNIYSNGNITGPGEIQGTAQVAIDSQLGVANDAVKDAQETFGHNATETDIAQIFVSPGDNNITMVSLLLKKVCENNNPNKCPPTTKVRILETIAGAPGPDDDIPDTSNVIAEGDLDPDLVSMDEFGWVNVTMDTPAPLTLDGTYWILISPSDSNPGGNSLRHWISSKSGTDAGYGNGVAKYTSDWNAVSPTWTKILGDLNFRIYLATGNTFIDGTTITEDAYAFEIKNATIGQDAYYTIVSNTTAGGVECPVPYPDPVPDPNPYPNCHPDTEAPPLEPMPVSDSNITDWQGEASAGGTYEVCSNDNTQTCTDDSECGGAGDTCDPSDYIVDGSDDQRTLGPKIIDGDLKVLNSAHLKVSGTIWVTGNIFLDNNAVIYLHEDYGSLSGLVLTNGDINVSNNVFFCGSGYDSGPPQECDTTEGSYIMFLSTSLKDTEADPAIDVDNNAMAVIFYASAGAVKLWNNAGVFEATAYKLILEENATVTYESGLADAKFISGPGASWALKAGTWQEL